MAALASHRACGECRKQMVARNQPCPWCRDEVVWTSVFGFLDGLKGKVGTANDPQALAALMMDWQEYEMMRSNSDVVTFAHHMVHDVALCAHIDRALEENHAFLRDSAGLWCRFHSLIAAGELVCESDGHRTRIERAVEETMARFEADGGGYPQHGGAMYAQLAVAFLCGQMCGMSTDTMAAHARRAGAACAKFWGSKVDDVRPLMPSHYVEALTESVWGSAAKDPVRRAFFPELLPPELAADGEADVGSGGSGVAEGEE